MKINHQRGAVMLLELAVVAVISTLVIANQINDVKNKAVEAQFSGQGDLMNTLKGAVSTYIANNYSALVNGTAVAGVVNPYAPTIAELQNPAVSPLPSGFNATSLLGPAYVVTIAKSPAACVAPACDITGLVYLNAAVVDTSNGRVDGARIGVALSQIGGDGAVSDSMDPANVRGLGGSFLLPNPAGSVAGILAVRTGYGSSAFSQFLRRDGSLPMTGNLNMGGKDIANAGGATLAGGSNAKSLNVGNSVFYGDGANSAVRQDGAFYVQNRAGTGGADLSAQNLFAVNNITAGNYVNSAAVSTGYITNTGNINNAGDIFTRNITASGSSTSLDVTATRDMNVGRNLTANRGFFSYDNFSAYGSDAALSVSENTVGTGRIPKIEFHAGGYNEGYIAMNGAGVRKFLLRDVGNTAGGVGLDATGDISSSKSLTAPVVNVATSVNIAANGAIFGAGKLVIDATAADLYLQPFSTGTTFVGGGGGSGNLNIKGTTIGRNAYFSNDGQTTCCATSPRSLYLSEATSTTGNVSSIQFHNAGASEGYIALNKTGYRRLTFADNQGSGLGLETTGTITAPNIVLPAGNTLNIAGIAFYGDSTNAAVRANGGLYVQHFDGSAAPINAGVITSSAVNTGVVNATSVVVNGVTYYGDSTNGAVIMPGAFYLQHAGGARADLIAGQINATSIVNTGNMGTAGNHTTQGTLVANLDNYALIARNAASQDNSQPSSPIGSLYVNDVYLRSANKWASSFSSGSAYQSFGTFYGRYDGSNPLNRPVRMYAYGGYACSTEGSSLNGFIGNVLISHMTGTGSLAFSMDIPAGATYTVTSSACTNNGSFAVFQFI